MSHLRLRALLTKAKLPMGCLRSVFSLLGLLLILNPTKTFANQLYVYLPTDLSALSVQKAFDKSCPSFKTTVFSRAKEFWSSYDANKPPFLISSNKVFQQLDELRTVITGVSDGNLEQPYLLVATGNTVPDPQALDGKRVGVLNLLGRRQTKTFVQTILNSKVSVRGAAKPRDLMPLLNFKMVDMLLVEKSMLGYLKERSNQEFSFFELSEQYSIAGAVTKNADTSMQETLASCVKALGEEGFNQTFFRVDQWKN